MMKAFALKHIVIQVTIQLTTYSFPLYYLPQGGYVSLAVSDCWFLVGLSTGQRKNDLNTE